MYVSADLFVFGDAFSAYRTFTQKAVHLGILLKKILDSPRGIDAIISSERVENGKEILTKAEVSGSIGVAERGQGTQPGSQSLQRSSQFSSSQEQHRVAEPQSYKPNRSGDNILNSKIGPTADKDSIEFSSPDEAIKMKFKLAELGDISGCPVYDVDYKGETVIADSRFGLSLKDIPTMQSGFSIIRISDDLHDSVWFPVYGERSEIRDNFRQVKIELKMQEYPDYLLDMTFRIYNEGVAFCYTVKSSQGENKPFTIEDEETEFRFLADHTTWTTYSAQGRYSKVQLSEIKPGCERPLVISMENGPYVALGEARLVDHARMKFKLLEEDPNCVVSDLSGHVQGNLPVTTPWRVIMIADTPGKLLENNFILLNLNDPCEIDDISWIEPGKVIREVTLTTQGGKACVDFAAKHNLQYVEYDAGWYGEQGDKSSDASFVSVDPKRSGGSLNLQEVLRYANEKGIGIILYVNHIALEQQIDQLLPIYKEWGIKGIKFGFVNVGSQHWTSWLHESIRKTAAYNLMVDVHDEYRPTGYSRTYPNFMTQEGICGDEEKQSTENSLMVLFNRMLAGAGDQTVCYFDPRVDELWNHAYQLAKSVCFYSPWHFLYWYDRPEGSPRRAGGAGGNAGVISETPELKFFDHLVTVWDETRVINGSIGEYATIARRSGSNWFVGTMNNSTPRQLDIPLDFLEKDTQYTAHIYTDDHTMQTRTRVRIERREVNSETILKADLLTNGGQAVRLLPQ